MRSQAALAGRFICTKVHHTLQLWILCRIICGWKTEQRAKCDCWVKFHFCSLRWNDIVQLPTLWQSAFTSLLPALIYRAIQKKYLNAKMATYAEEEKYFNIKFFLIVYAIQHIFPHKSA